MGPVKDAAEAQDWRKMKELRKQRKEAKVLKQLAKEALRQEAEAKAKKDEEKAKEPQPVVKRCTLSIAVPGSILENAQSPPLRTYLAGQIARAACIFKVDEVIVFDDIGTEEPAKIVNKPSQSSEDERPQARHSCLQLARILQYLECPQYLRKAFFPQHKDLSFAGVLNPLDAPHHLLQHEEYPFREGVVVNQLSKSGSVVDVGLKKNVRVDKYLVPGVRVTVEFLPNVEGSKKLRGRLVSPNAAVTGRYWGYNVRVATSLSAVFSEGPYKKGYDLTIGTSDKGKPVDTLTANDIPKYEHALIVFGGLEGLEAALEVDPVLNIEDPSLLFDLYLNTCPDQGTRTIRTEEAILISLAALRPKLHT